LFKPFFQSQLKLIVQQLKLITQAIETVQQLKLITQAIETVQQLKLLRQLALDASREGASPQKIRETRA